MELDRVLEIFAKGILDLDKSRIAHKTFQPGAGPYGEPQLFKKIVEYASANYGSEVAGIKTTRRPDILIPNQWAIECKIVRPYGDNAVIAEHWSQNLLHPYPGNTSSIGDIYKLLEWEGTERKAVVVVTYGENVPKIDIEVIVRIFELIARQGLNLGLMERKTKQLDDLVHPVHQRAIVFGWEVLNLAHP